jgi:hypothetical protein
MNKKLREISDGLIPLGIQPYIFPLRKTKIWKKKAKENLLGLLILIFNPLTVLQWKQVQVQVT